jgi:predicted porin
MKFKTSAIALAIAGTIAVPMAVQAEGSVYASARVGLNYQKTDSADDFTNAGGGALDVRTKQDGSDEDQASIKSFSSRFGARGETDMGNGMTGFGRYEWDVDFDGSDDDPTGDISVRHRYVGVKGDFGSITMGQTYGAFYNHTVGPVDNPWWGSSYAMVAYVGREDHQLSYAGSAGAISFGVTLIIESDADEEDIDIVETGVSIPIGDTTLGFGARLFQGDDDPTTLIDEEDAIVSVTWSGIAVGDMLTLGFNVQNQDEDDSFLIEALIGNAYVHVEALSVDATDADKLATTLGYTQSLGRNTTMWYELMIVDNDDGGTIVDADGSGGQTAGDTFTEAADFTVVRAILKYDIL